MPEAQGTPLPPNKLTKINNFSTEAAVLNKHRLSYNGELSRQFVIPDFLLHFPLEVIVSVSWFIIVSCDIFRFPYCSLSTAFPALSMSNKDKAKFLETLISFQVNKCF